MLKKDDLSHKDDEYFGLIFVAKIAQN